MQEPQATKKRNGSGNSHGATSAAAVPDFDAKAFLKSVGAGGSAAKYPAAKTVFRQGDPADAVFYIQ